jgi:hypothetical protein
MSKSTNRRKSIAIALAVLGVAGLSLASASQLGLTGTTSVQSGILAVNADCQLIGPITVAFDTPTLVGGRYVPVNVNLTKIDAGCVARTYKVALLKTDGTLISESAALPVPAVVGPATTSTITYPVGVSSDLVGKVALTIYS